jgi:two-component system sensor kinase FixL
MSSTLESLGALRIFIVEDEARIVEEMAERLVRAGYEVVGTSDNGEAAIEAAVALRPALILMAVRLQGAMDGIRAAELIQRRLSVPILYLTAHSDQGTLQRVKASGASGYLQKPFQSRNLLTAIDLAVHRFKMERHLEESLLTYATILSSSSEALIATDANGRVRFMNPAAERLTGWTIRDAQGQRCSAVVCFAPSGGEPGEDRVGQVLASRETVTLGADEQLLSRHGLRVPVGGGISAVIDNLDRLVGATITLRDVTEARKATADLKAAAEQLRALMDTAVDGVMLLDAAGSILMFNAACVRLFGYTAKEMAGCAIKTLVPGMLTDDLDRPLRLDRPNSDAPVMITARPTRGHRKDGSTFPVELSLGEASRPGQSVFVSVIRDISERQALETALLDAIGHEQRRFGNDLHDSLGQELTGLSLLLSAFVQGVRHGERLEVTDLEQAEEVARQALQSCRSIAHGLSPVTESQGGLIAGLRELVARLKTDSGPTLDFEAIGMARLGLSPAASDHLFRIAQEALANALRHAHANSIRVKLDVEPASVRLEICDDGDGLSSTEISASGLGLRTMRYRASLLGAKFQITRLDPAGTCIVCECPQAA